MPTKDGGPRQRARPQHRRPRARHFKVGWEFAAGVIGTLIARPLARSLGLVAATAAAATITTVSVTGGPAGHGIPVKQQWLTHVAGVKVERLYDGHCTGYPADLTVPPKGIGHTTEGSFAGALGVFSYHYRPTFMLGRDGTRIRIVQFCPIGEMAAALKNQAGGVETNRWARVQIELVGFSKYTPWLPKPAVEHVYAALLLQLRDSAGIPLHQCYPDGDGHRTISVWQRCAGWLGHRNVPENDHVDPGAMRWSKLLADAQKLAPVVNPGVPEGEPIRGKPRATAAQARVWARRYGATSTFVALARIYWQEAPHRGGVRADVAYAQAAHETGFGHFGGVLNASFHNPCGMKKAAGGGDYDPHAHQHFASWRLGIRACIDHLALYAAARGYPRASSPDPKQLPGLRGIATTVEKLGGKWAPSPGYGGRVLEKILELDGRTP
jgi:hypothetical protein